VIDTARSVTGKAIAVRECPRRAGDPVVLVADASKIRQELGWNAHYSELRPILETTWNWHKSHPKGYGEQK
jgi:UDP-glucose 4-epimerase